MILSVNDWVAIAVELCNYDGSMNRRNKWLGKSLQRLVKEVVDRALAVLLLLVFLPILGLVAIAIYRYMGAPVLFRQPRPGKDGHIFNFYKFRTMTDQRDANGQLLPDAERLPRFGQLLRSSSLDELPQLWNILKGEMSFVGPRPLVVEYLERYSPEQARRHEVKPGITGLAQVNGRNLISWDEKFKLDVWYIDHWNLGLDLKILFLTVKTVLRREGISQEGFATSEEFMGSSQKSET
ncbi:MAG TPA: sugar transferase [Stenomitos sp.]